MKPEVAELRRQQLDRQLAPLRRAHLDRPTRGWVRAVREALGINKRQLARRMNVAPSQVSQIEDGEVRNVVSVHTLQRVASALECELVYALVPRGGVTFEELLHRRALRVANGMVERVADSMALEDQGVDRQFRKRQVHKLVAELVRTVSKDLWNE